ncbi:MAG: serine hydrolase, partial [Pseudomonadota bacterium]
GAQIVPADWVEEMTTPAETWEGYGYQVWLGDRAVSDEMPETDDPNLSWMSESYAANDMIVLSGYGRQRVWVIPSQDLVIVRATRTWSDDWDESVIPNTVLRGVK